MGNLFSIIIATIFVSNYVLGQFLGICPALGVTSKVETARGMGMAVIFVITLASIITWIIQYYILDPLNIGFLQTVVFILVIASLVQSVETVMKKSMPALYGALGVFLPLITTNCVVLGVAIKAIDSSYTLVETIVYALAAAIGFTLAITILAYIRERIEYNSLPETFKGVPITLVTLGLMAIAFMGFAGLA
ncbi:Electron transport complex protein rnfA [Anaerococcus prevotii]|uniref:Ion-translocating oxidoreductase complex subunit A n=1 Tax=Anaerococcus prevotii (strain ATCC 9321 / DSM 20548 / JCM 6508 / NCTC 11806 / PC1) TaxID=525919 RepID=C7RDT3_ANAPD|nr:MULTISPECIES: RnfABCDGE type electron transport complex subunit A [Anaerococcus]MDD6918606.1 RnfABCDGE type electron transport complex subunit A [Peptoniphilaceae bacterium]ACV29346.1 electron transport complex, RnfABCDGE type, A subunit [Anaerococcus prevotii DSM 20548]MCI5972660.1 RnfABCDGE type electron transport complex subunit A [Anaerococcus sp.]MDY2927277.1 RnfABCDGE type electron transport complex subunit A [Anaerococcus sp.]SUU95020.1 Electron transport complex protein rnfA [Anaero